MTVPRLLASDLIALFQEAGILRAVQGRVPDSSFVSYTPDSRKLSDGDLFLAYKGVHFDAHALLPELLQAKSQCGFIVDQESSWSLLKEAPWACLVSDTREAWAWIAAHAHGRPERSLRLLGVTGTNGKTSTVWFLRQILAALGEKVLTLGTLGIYLGDEFFAGSHTTPDPDETFRYLALARDRGMGWAAMEVSSHALVQKRLSPLRFDAVAFTSFSRDHLDFHASMEEYFAAKWELIERYRKPLACAWLSERIDAFLPATLAPNLRRYSSQQVAADQGVSYQVHSMDLTSTDLSLHLGSQSWRGRLPFSGDFAVENFAVAWDSIRVLTGRSLEPENWTRIAPVPGRFEPVVAAAAHGFAVIVDYAHTPDALEKTLIKLRGLTQGHVWVVFGCGGDRDKGKRPLMGAAAELHADRLVLTSDNPRTEEPQAILQDIQAGLKHPERALVEVDRRRAIAHAVKAAKAGDAILIAGKGHEDYQILGTQKYPFDDRLVATEFLLALT